MKTFCMRHLAILHDVSDHEIMVTVFMSQNDY